jgi:hypothetical protein
LPQSAECNSDPLHWFRCITWFYHRWSRNEMIEQRSPVHQNIHTAWQLFGNKFEENRPSLETHCNDYTPEWWTTSLTIDSCKVGKSGVGGIDTWLWLVDIQNRVWQVFWSFQMCYIPCMKPTIDWGTMKGRSIGHIRVQSLSFIWLLLFVTSADNRNDPNCVDCCRFGGHKKYARTSAFRSGHLILVGRLHHQELRFEAFNTTLEKSSFYRWSPSFCSVGFRSPFKRSSTLPSVYKSNC